MKRLQTSSPPPLPSPPSSDPFSSLRKDYGVILKEEWILSRIARLICTVGFPPLTTLRGWQSSGEGIEASHRRLSSSLFPIPLLSGKIENLVERVEFPFLPRLASRVEQLVPPARGHSTVDQSSPFPTITPFLSQQSFSHYVPHTPPSRPFLRRRCGQSPIFPCHIPDPNFFFFLDSSPFFFFDVDRKVFPAPA